jgi:hypothetical protein
MDHSHDFDAVEIGSSRATARHRSVGGIVLAGEQDHIALRRFPFVAWPVHKHWAAVIWRWPSGAAWDCRAAQTPEAGRLAMLLPPW